MPPKKTALVILFGIILGLGLWWFTQPKAADPGNMVVVTTLTKAATLNGVAQANQVEKPKVTTGGAMGEINAVSTYPSTDSSDPRNDLKTALPDIARLFRADDYLDVYLTYGPPGEITPARADAIRASQQQAQANPNPYDSLRNLASARFLESLQGLTPIYNDAGDEARYQATMLVPRPPDGVVEDAVLTTEYFIKVNGKWYWKGEVQPH